MVDADVWINWENTGDSAQEKFTQGSNLISIYLIKMIENRC
jgi:hypothetical protein